MTRVICDGSAIEANYLSLVKVTYAANTPLRIIVTVIAGGIGAFYAWRGLKRLSPGQLVPTQTVATLKEDVEWLKRQRT